MADLLKLVCPTCGGKLKVSKNAVSMVCQFCGNEHLVKHEAGGVVMLEAFARCPICGRNDKVEKVSAVIASQSHEISGVEQKSEVITNAQGQQQAVIREVPFSRKQISVLGQRLALPAPPDPSRFPPYPDVPKAASRRGGVAAIVIGGLGILLSPVCGISSMSSFAAALDSYDDPSGLAMTGLVFVILGIGAFFVGAGLVVLGIVLTVRAGRLTSSNMERYREQVEAVKREHEEIQGDYEHTVSRWKELYYCARDDCVYIPGQNTSAPLTEMKEYLSLKSADNLPG